MQRKLKFVKTGQGGYWTMSENGCCIKGGCLSCRNEKPKKENPVSDYSKPEEHNQKESEEK